MIFYNFLEQKEKDKPKGKIRNFTTINQISEFIKSHNYSPGFFNPNKRSSVMWKNTNVIVLDIDEEQPLNKSMEDVRLQIKELRHIIAPTKSHQKVKGENLKKCDRYRILLFLENKIFDQKEYTEIIQKVSAHFNLKTDSRCWDATHFYYSSISIYSMNTNGSFLNLDELKYLNDLNPTNDEPAEFKYMVSECAIPEALMVWINRINRKDVKYKKECFIRILMAQRHLVSINHKTGERVGSGRNPIPQVFMSDYIHLDAKTLRKWLSELVALKQLVRLDNKYYSGRAMEYKALNDLAEAVIWSCEAYFSDKQRVLPETIEDGKWELELIKAVWVFAKDEYPNRFYNWVESLPTYHAKADRKFKRERAWMNMKKRLEALRNSVS